ncbi:MAG: DUF1552 domain-containing protein [Pseudomonadota bacterium]
MNQKIRALSSQPVSRRSLLQGAGACIALPFLESLATPALAVSPAGPQRPKRFSLMYLPNGMRMDQFRPASAGADYPMSPILEGLAPWKQAFSVVTGLAHYNAQPLGDPGGAHGRSCAAYLTGAHPKPTEGSDLYCGVSLDQQIAATLGATTPFPSLELGIEPSSLLGSCDIGFSCTYTNTLSWRSPTQALPVTVNPREVFERLFGDATATDAKSRAALFDRRASILDFVLRDAERLNRNLGKEDRPKLDQYLTALREVEQRIQRLRTTTISGDSDALVLPGTVPEDFRTHVELMIDLQVLAFQSDLTRVCTFMLGRELSNRAYPEIGVTDSHHSLSHHGGNEEKIAKLVKISRFHLSQVGYLIDRLRDTADGDGTLLESTLILAGSSLGESNDHDCMDLPAVIAGADVTGNQHHQLPKHTPMCNLMVGLIQQLGMEATTFGDSTGSVTGLST